jgi:hypothetical protein
MNYFFVRSRDGLGNIGGWSESIQYQVDRSGPT